MQKGVAGLMNSELNSRQWALYNLLKNNPDTYFKQIDIVYALKEFYCFTDENTKFHDSTARLQITKDIRAINESDVIQKIIISNSNGVKLASREEFEEYIKAEYAMIFRKLKRTRQKARKAGLDGQMRFTAGKERNTVEAFVDEINRLKAARLNKGLKLVDVVKIMKQTEKGFDIALLSKMENGICKPTNRQLMKLAEIYGKEPLELIDDVIVVNDETA